MRLLTVTQSFKDQVKQHIEHFAKSHSQQLFFRDLNQALNYLHVLVNEYDSKVKEQPRTYLSDADYIPLYPDLYDDFAEAA